MGVLGRNREIRCVAALKCRFSDAGEGGRDVNGGELKAEAEGHPFDSVEVGVVADDHFLKDEARAKCQRTDGFDGVGKMEHSDGAVCECVGFKAGHLGVRRKADKARDGDREASLCNCFDFTVEKVCMPCLRDSFHRLCMFVVNHDLVCVEVWV